MSLLGGWHWLVQVMKAWSVVGFARASVSASVTTRVKRNDVFRPMKKKRGLHARTASRQVALMKGTLSTPYMCFHLNFEPVMHSRAHARARTAGSLKAKKNNHRENVKLKARVHVRIVKGDYEQAAYAAIEAFEC